MNYLILKHIIEGLVKSYKCNDCGNSGAKETDIEIIGLAGNTASFDITCPNCGKSAIVKAQMTQVNIGEQIGNIAKKIEELKTQTNNKNTDEDKKEPQIQDIEIVELKKTLKKENLSVGDILDVNQ